MCSADPGESHSFSAPGYRITDSELKHIKTSENNQTKIADTFTIIKILPVIELSKCLPVVDASTINKSGRNVRSAKPQKSTCMIVHG